MLKDIGYGGLDQYSKAYNRPRSLKTVSRLRPNFVVALLSVLCYKFHVAHHILNAIISMKSKKSYKAAMAAMDKLYGHDNKQFAVFE